VKVDECYYCSCVFNFNFVYIERRLPCLRRKIADWWDVVLTMDVGQESVQASFDSKQRGDHSSSAGRRGLTQVQDDRRQLSILARDQLSCLDHQVISRRQRLPHAGPLWSAQCCGWRLRRTTSDPHQIWDSVLHCVRYSGRSHTAHLTTAVLCLSVEHWLQ